MDSARILLFGAKSWTDKAFVERALCESFKGIPMEQPLCLVHTGDTGVASLADNLWGTWVRKYHNLFDSAEKHMTVADEDAAGKMRRLVGLGAQVCVVILDDESSTDAELGAQLARDAGIRVVEFAAERSAA